MRELAYYYIKFGKLLKGKWRVEAKSEWLLRNFGESLKGEKVVGGGGEGAGSG